MNIEDLLYFEEGYRSEPYWCSERFPTVGIGKCLGGRGESLNHYDFTVPLSVAKEWVKCDCIELYTRLSRETWFDKQTQPRKTILLSMAYQMGVDGLLCFSNMIRALEFEDFEQAKVEAIDSRWYRQTPERATRHANVLLTGNIENEYKEFIK